jgi:arsenic resistance protein ArsH
VAALLTWGRRPCTTLTAVVDSPPPGLVKESYVTLSVDGSRVECLISNFFDSRKAGEGRTLNLTIRLRGTTDFGAEVRVFDPVGLPVFDRTSNEHEKVQELRSHSIWSEGHVWISPEQHGSMTAAFKNQIDWLPLSDGAVRPTQGRTLAVMEVSGGSQSFNAVNQLRILGRWMRMFTIPNQSSVAKAWTEFDDEGRMKPSDFRDRVVDVCEELFRFTILLRDRSTELSTRYSEQKQLRQKGALNKGQGV